MGRWLRWRPVLAAVLLVVDSVTAAHWSLGAYVASLVFAALPCVCWLGFAPPGRLGAAVGGALVAFSVVPGLVFGPGGLAMYQMTRAGTWTVVLYLPVSFGVIGSALLVLAVRARRNPQARGRNAVRVATVAFVLGTSLVVGVGCWWFELSWENVGPVWVGGPIVGLLPDDVRVVDSDESEGGSSGGITGRYTLAGARGQSAQALADEVSRSVARTTGWPVPVGFGARCFRPAGLAANTGQYCVEIDRYPADGSGIVLFVETGDDSVDLVPLPD